jgi:deoxyribonuclease-4
MNEKILIGRHCLMNKPEFLLGSVKEAVNYGSNSLMIYLGSPQNSFRQPLSELKVAEFKSFCFEKKISLENIIVHAPYLINLSNSVNEKIFFNSIAILKREIDILGKIGLSTIVLHPGSSLGFSVSDSLNKLVEGLDSVLESNSNLRIALETMSGRKGEIGSNFGQIEEVMKRVKFSERIGVCWDTCHLYSAGYDIKNKLESVISEFEARIGLEKLWVIHINDSLFEIGAKKDRHENIGYGKIGSKALKNIVWHPKLKNAVKILETPRKRLIYKEEIKTLLES